MSNWRLIDTIYQQILWDYFNKKFFIQRQVLTTLGSIAKHDTNLAEAVVETEVFPNVLIHMGHPDENVVRSAAVLTKEVCKHTSEVNFQ